MPSAASLSINDATPTAHVFVPVSVSPQLSLFRNVAGAAISASEEQVGLSLSRATANRATNKVKLTLSVPHEQTIDGQVVVRDIFRFSGEFVLPDSMSAAERGHAMALVLNAMTHADVQDYVTDLEAFW
jgi:hypothetical protein